MLENTQLLCVITNFMTAVSVCIYRLIYIGLRQAGVEGSIRTDFLQKVKVEKRKQQTFSKKF